MLRNYTKLNDAELVCLAQTDDSEAMGILYQRYREQLLEFFKNKIASVEDAEDLVQVTFFEVMSSLEKIRDPKRFRGWLFAIAKNIRAGRIRRDAQHRKPVSLDEVHEADSEQTSFVESLAAPEFYQPEHSALENELRDIRLCFEKTLTRKELVVFRLRNGSDKKYKAIAKELGIPIGSTRALYSQTVSKMRVWLETHYPEIVDMFKK